MRTIFEYPLQVIKEQVIELPMGTQIIKIAMRGKKPFMLAIVDSDNITVNETFYIVKTGQPLPSFSCNYIDSFKCDGVYWFHLFRS